MVNIVASCDQVQWVAGESVLGLVGDGHRLLVNLWSFWVLHSKNSSATIRLYNPDQRTKSQQEMAVTQLGMCANLLPGGKFSRNS